MVGGAEEDRTPDLRIANATLSQLSYRPVDSKKNGQEIIMRRNSSIETDFTAIHAYVNHWKIPGVSNQ